MNAEQQRNPKGWGHRLREENRGLKEKIAGLRKKLKRQQKELRNTWKLIMDIPGGLMLIQQQKIIFANETVCRELGYTLEEMMEKDLSDLVHPNPVPFAVSRQQKNIVDTSVSGQHETYMITKTGHTLCAEVRVNKIRHNGRRAFLINIINLDERKEEEKRLRQSVKTEALVRMASGFKRELEECNTFLEQDNPEIQGLGSHKDKSLTSFKRIEALREKEALLSRHLHCLTKTEYDPSDIGLLDLKKTLKTAIAISHPEMTAASERSADHITFKTFLRTLSPVYGCQRELQDVFINLILNAMEALPDGGEIYLTTEEHSGFAHVYFQDNGVGIPEEIIDNIFDPFFTTKDGTRRGLGLSLAHAIIARHQGEISVASHKGKGSAFLVKLPLARHAPSITGSAAKKGIKDSHILIIGNEGVVTDILCTLLVSKGGNIATTSSYREALKLLKEDRFDLVIADQDAPDAMNAKTISAIKELRPDLPVAIINTLGKPGSLNRSKKMGADLAVGRPLDMDRLLVLVSRLLVKGGARK